MNLYLDIETIPSQDPDVHARIAETVTCPRNITKADSIAAWEADKKPALVKEAIAKTSFDGAVGHICCIGWAIDGRVPTSFIAKDVRAEAKILSAFFAEAQRIIAGDATFYTSPTIVGHNVVDFDIRFIWQRAIVLGVRVPSWFPRDPKPWGNETFDTMTAFAGSHNRISMDNLCRALGIDDKGDVDGSMVAGMWERGDNEAIAEYCRADVERTRAIHRKMMVAFGQEAA